MTSVTPLLFSESCSAELNCEVRSQILGWRWLGQGWNGSDGDEEVTEEDGQ